MLYCVFSQNLMSCIFDWVEHPMIAVTSDIKTSFTLLKINDPLFKCQYIEK